MHKRNIFRRKLSKEKKELIFMTIPLALSKVEEVSLKESVFKMEFLWVYAWRSSLVDLGSL